jgi:hypothetical protein
MNVGFIQNGNNVKTVHKNNNNACVRDMQIEHLVNTLGQRVTPRSVLFAPSTRGVLLPTLRQTRVIASHMGASSVDRVLLLPMRRVKERRRLG